MVNRQLTLVIPSLAFGGAERVISEMANHFSRSENDVTLITLDSTETDTYKLSPRVNRIALGMMQESRGFGQAIVKNLQRVRRLRRAIQTAQPQTVISFTDRMNVVTLLACLGLNVDVVVSERIDPARHDIGRTWSLLRRLVTPRSRALVVQTERTRQQMRGIMRHKPIFVIPNAARTPSGTEKGTGPICAKHPLGRSGKLDLSPFPCPHSAGRRIVAMGRLERQKGFDLLIDAFSRIAAKCGEWTLEILGEGPQRGELERLIEGHSLRSRVTLAGWIAEPESVLRQADLFVLSSRYEGFPNALLEAMACGLPVVSFDCPSGPAEIVRHDVDGLLVPADDVDALSAAIERLISNPQQRLRLADRAPDVLERFSTERFFAQWEAVLRGDDEQTVARLTIDH